MLSNSDVENLIRKKNVLALTADLTRPDTVVESLLHELGSQSVPFLAIFPGDHPYEPIIMRDVLKKSQVIHALEKLEDKR